MKYLIKNSITLLFLIFITTYVSSNSLHSEEIHGKIKVTKGYLKECTGFITDVHEEFEEIQYNVTLTCDHFYKSGEIKRTYTKAYIEPIYNEKLHKKLHSKGKKSFNRRILQR